MKQGFGIAVGNLTGIFATALQATDRENGQSIAVIDNSIKGPIPKSTKVKTVPNQHKHTEIAQLAKAGLIIGGGEGTIKLANCFLALNKPLVALSGSGGVVDAAILPSEALLVETVDVAIVSILELCV